MGKVLGHHQVMGNIDIASQSYIAVILMGS